MDIARGMSCLHTQRPPIIHRDLKAANLLVSARWGDGGPESRLHLACACMLATGVCNMYQARSACARGLLSTVMERICCCLLALYLQV
jgi:hypothetical protein